MAYSEALPGRDDPFWESAPLEQILAPLSSERLPGTPQSTAEGEERLERRMTESRKKARRKITPEIKARVVKLIRQDITYREIALACNIGTSTVEQIASAHGIGRGRGRQAGDATCAVPGCGRQLRRDSRSGVCREHNHAAGYCRCTKCRD